ncbi:5-methylcytosine-specific restriction enzyme B [Salinimicrobium catena]|uniref:5-methylcytosine-specific restriction enzyme B n=2 Tax=Salinimicrobium catena TaxID=390640 RepID=A0A1H5N619_9FLAO|nr:5-methylcytosine-specific restriction enzyme B [Salinimicrobium catena]SEE96337.1 5-methylcytosine-specific restriction enzyme B [Salinimicrobium catena]
MRFARQEYDGEDWWGYGGGPPTNKFLERMGFEIFDKGQNNDPLANVIKKYKAYIRKNGLEDEEYKWKLLAQYKGKPNPHAGNLYNEIKSVDFANLLYYNAYRAMSHLAKDRQEDFRALLLMLFDESLDLKERVIRYDRESLALYRQLVPDKKLGHHQDERTISTLLTFHNPEKYTFYKNSFYVQLCKLIGVKPKPKGEKFVHYLELVEGFIEDYIKEDQELLELFKAKLPEGVFEDPNHLILAQDILYGVLDRNIGRNRRYWRIGTKADDTSYWANMKEKNRVAIGWSNLGDLDDLNVQSQKELYNVFKEKKIELKNNQLTSRKAGEIFAFYNDLSIGDIVLAQDGDNIYGIGEVTEGYTYNEAEDFAHEKGVDWKVFDPPFKNKTGRNTTFYPLEDYNLIQKIENVLGNESGNNESTMAKDLDNKRKGAKRPLNRILFGPPGTGKTYNTINKALEICGVEVPAQRQEAIIEFDNLVKKERIVFTTFHQSMAYEDFIEGIKPQEPAQEGHPVIFKIEPGIFKKISVNASFALAEKDKSSETENLLDFNLAFDKFKDDVEEKLSKEVAVELATKNGGKVIVDSISQQGNFNIKHPGRDLTYTVSKSRLSRLHNGLPDLGSVNNIDSEFREIIGGSNSTVNWAVLNEIRNKYFKNVEQAKARTIDWEDKYEIVKKLKKSDYKGKDGENYVLIIDEINRGNVSAVFGELITLIEDDKRLGREEGLVAQLPYSKEQFGVPPNLYILGTMNTADRSVEALDTALRRRFSFEEIPPNSEIIKEGNGLIEIDKIELNILLDKINKRIEKLLDKDHMIGHSFFMNLHSVKDLKLVFHNKILPLLQEYFFGDFGKIGLVIGKSFFEVIDSNEDDDDIFADFDYQNGFNERPVYHLKNVKKMDDQAFILALKNLIQ